MNKKEKKTKNSVKRADSALVGWKRNLQKINTNTVRFQCRTNETEIVIASRSFHGSSKTLRGRVLWSSRVLEERSWPAAENRTTPVAVIMTIAERNASTDCVRRRSGGQRRLPGTARVCVWSRYAYRGHGGRARVRSVPGSARFAYRYGQKSDGNRPDGNGYVKPNVT